MHTVFIPGFTDTQRTVRGENIHTSSITLTVRVCVLTQSRDGLLTELPGISRRTGTAKTGDLITTGTTMYTGIRVTII